MVKPEWGVKRICNNCGAPFYDLLRDPIVCPKCSTTYDPEAVLKSRRARPAAVEKEVAPVVIEDEVEIVPDDAVEIEDDEAVVDGAADEEEDPDLIEDASELGEDEDDMAEVIENIEDEDER